MEFWNSDITNASWDKLLELNKEIDFLLIGGWAVYLYTKLQKSKDIDIIVDYGALRKISQRYTLAKNDRLKKYEIKLERFDIDVYLPKYSKLAVPPEDILLKFRDNIDGINVPKVEVLMTLKLGALSERKESIKGGKDAIDILALLFYSGFKTEKLKEVLDGYAHPEYARLLLDTLNKFDKKMLSYLNLNEKSFSRYKNEKAEELKKIL